MRGIPAKGSALAATGGVLKQTGRRGVVAAGSPLSAAAGAAMLALGGNAVDAAVAAAFASFVAEIQVVNIGGGGYALIGTPEPDGAATAYDFFCKMPSPQAERDFREIQVDFGNQRQPFFIGRASTAVPGVVAGLCRMAEDRGRLPLSDLLGPAIRLARDGFMVTAEMYQILEILAPIFNATPGLRSMMGTSRGIVRPGDRLTLPALADTLAALASEGSDLFYKGAIAEAICSDHRQHGGLITPSDLATYQVELNPPLRIDYRGFEVLLPPPSSHGGVLIGFALKLLEHFDLAATRFHSLDHLRILAHVMRQTNRARADWDRWSDEPRKRVARFLHPDHVKGFRQHIERDLAAESLGRQDSGQEPPGSGAPGHTSHIAALDEDGLAVSITTSAGENAGYVVGDTGICLNNVLGEHDINPDGFFQYPTGARLFSMMSPTLVLEGGRPVLALGSAGSNRLRSAILQTISNCIDFGLPLERAVNDARIHYENHTLELECGIDADVAAGLERQGFKVNLWDRRSLFFGGAQAVSAHDGRLHGVGDDRRGGAAVVLQ